MGDGHEPSGYPDFAAIDAECDRIMALTEEELVAEAGGQQAFDALARAGKRAVDLGLLRHYAKKVCDEAAANRRGENDQLCTIRYETVLKLRALLPTSRAKE